MNWFEKRLILPVTKRDWIRLRPWRNWLRNVRNGVHVVRLPMPLEQWSDSDDRLFFACFECLRWYVEKELGKPQDGWGEHRGWRCHAEGDEHFIDLYCWYTAHTYRQMVEKRADTGDGWNEAQGKLEELVRQHGSLWT